MQKICANYGRKSDIQKGEEYDANTFFMIQYEDDNFMINDVAFST